VSEIKSRSLRKALTIFFVVGFGVAFIKEEVTVVDRQNALIHRNSEAIIVPMPILYVRWAHGCTAHDSYLEMVFSVMGKGEYHDARNEYGRSLRQVPNFGGFINGLVSLLTTYFDRSLSRADDRIDALAADVDLGALWHIMRKIQGSCLTSNCVATAPIKGHEWLVVEVPI
jgi:hypothetical protein